MFRAPADAGGTGQITLDGPEGRHAADVRRLRRGESIWLTDGVGTRWEGVVDEVRRGGLDVAVERVVTEPRSVPRLVVFQALAKGGRDEAAVEAMTEVGVDEIVGWSASRSIAKWTDRTGAKWQSTIDAAAKQARRTWWPEAFGPATTADVATRVGTADVAVVLHESATDSLASIDLATANEVVVIVGPEGGISDEELDAMTVAGARVVRLGESVLRSSTAGVAALSVLLARTRWG
jgi:16S rRNA (uracil1498-N3)-methyltransferase